MSIPVCYRQRGENMDQRLETFLTVCATMNYRKAAEQLLGREYYRPTEQGREARCKARLEQIKAWKKEHGAK